MTDSDADRWRTVTERRFCDRFVYAVATTGVYCRPGCPSRLPLARNVRFFDTPVSAEIAGFRPCLRCRPRMGAAAAVDVLDTVVAACRAMQAAGGPLPSARLTEVTGWSERQLHRRFQEVLGTTPRAFGEALRVELLRPALRTASTVTAAAFDAGYGSVRGFYEQAGPRLGIEPARYAAGGTDEDLLWSTTGLPVESGEPQTLLAVVSRRGIVAVRIGPDPAPLLAEVGRELPLARLHRDDRVLAEVMTALAALAEGAAGGAALPLDLRGTAFQAAVWAALRTIPTGETRSYSQVASSLGRPSATRAVARACAANPAALVVPCHRVIRGDGGLGGFRWGLAVKEALLEAETGQAPRESVIA